MKRIFVSSVMLALVIVLSGCVTVNNDSVSLSKDRIIKIVRTGETGINMLLGFAESRGKDISSIKEISDSSFTLLYSILEVEINKIDYKELRSVLEQIRVVGDNALSLCLVSGSPVSVINQISIYLNDMYVVLDAVIAHLSNRI